MGVGSRGPGPDVANARSSRHRCLAGGGTETGLRVQGGGFRPSRDAADRTASGRRHVAFAQRTGRTATDDSARAESTAVSAERASKPQHRQRRRGDGCAHRVWAGGCVVRRHAADGVLQRQLDRGGDQIERDWRRRRRVAPLVIVLVPVGGAAVRRSVRVDRLGAASCRRAGTSPSRARRVDAARHVRQAFAASVPIRIVETSEPLSPAAQERAQESLLIDSDAGRLLSHRCCGTATAR